MYSYEIYCLCHNNPERKARMADRFRKYAEKEAIFPPTVDVMDPRVVAAPSNYSRAGISMVYGHLGMIRAFLESDAEFGIFSEDDVYIRRDFETSVQIAFDGFKRLGLDILLVGYLANYKPTVTTHHTNHAPLEPTYSFLSYDDKLWGSQMFILDRSSAARLLDKIKDPTSVPVFATDWCITKFGRRAALYPMLAVEEGSVVTGHPAHTRYHTQCTNIQYDPKYYD
jgi:hypothetical protein